MKKVIFIVLSLILIVPISEAALTQKWSKTPNQLVPTGFYTETEPIMLDVDNDGKKEIFLVGKEGTVTSHKTANTYMLCLEDDGSIKWSKSYTNYWGNGNEMSHMPIQVYDFVKSNPGYEITGGGISIMRDADTGEPIWTTTTNYFGWHNFAFIDYGTWVCLYTCGGSGIRRVNAEDGSVIKLVAMGDSQNFCWGGVSIADMNHDGSWDIAYGARGTSLGSQYAGLGCMLWDENLTTKRWTIDFICSSQAPKIYDIDNDGQDEIVILNQNSDKVCVVEYDGTYHYVGNSAPSHVASTLADINNDGTMDMLFSDSSPLAVVNVLTGTQTAISGNVFMPTSVADVLSYPGNEVIMCASNSATRGIYRWDGSYIKAESFTIHSSSSVVGDLDGDGLNEIVCCGSNNDATACIVYETEVSTPNPEPICNIPYGGSRNLNNGIYYPLPGTSYNPGPICGNGIIETGEDCVTCPQDVGPCAPNCGNGIIDSDETCINCPQDVGPCIQPVPGFELLLFLFAIFAIILRRKK